MAEVMKFQDLKEEGNEPAVKVFIWTIFFLFVLIAVCFRPLGSTGNKERPMWLKMAT